MIPNLNKLLRHTEEKWHTILFEQCRQQFSNVHLPSHDESHHQRVWNNAKLLLQHTVKLGISISETEIERLIVAVFFHDQGMSESLSKEHGKISRHICKAFFSSAGLKPPSGFDQVLQAIENHDQKEYSANKQMTAELDIQRLLNISDDLDAFGIVGAYRYMEIYLLRNIKPDLLPEAVLTNIGDRFQYFSDTFADDSSLVKSQGRRYAHTKNYYKDLNMQLKLVDYSPEFYLGPIGVLNYIRNKVIRNNRKLLDVCNDTIKKQEDFYVQHFFRRLIKELGQ